MLFRDLNYNRNMMRSRILAMFPDIQSISYKPHKYLFTLVHKAHLVIRFLGGKGLSKYFRYLEISTLPFTKLDSLPSSAPEIEILFVTTEKDFPVLKKAIQFASQATSHHKKTDFITLVPDHEVDICTKFLAELEFPVKVLKESQYINQDIRNRIKTKFGNRFGWVIQQILKDLYVLNSNSAGVLIVDSDTLLLEKRMWLDSEGNQLLTPSWEYHLPYYQFLETRGVCDNWPKFTFVSHHMLMQPKILREAFEYAGWASTEALIDSLVEVQNLNEQSPFCIEYELYGQYIVSRYPHLIKLEKWSNIGCSRDTTNGSSIEEIVFERYSGKYASVSLHSYL